MSKIKLNVDREPISSSSIADRQDFNQVLSEYRKSGTPSFKTKWVLGSVIGTAVLTGVFVSTSLDWDSNSSDQKSTKRDLLSEVKMPSKAAEVILKEQFETRPALTNSISEEHPPTQQKQKNERIEPTDRAKAASDGDKLVQSKLEEPKVQNQLQDNPEPKKSSPMPHIGKYYTGEVPVSVLCDNEQIQSGSNLAVVAYQISFFDGSKEVSQTVKGAAIPATVCDKLGRYNLGENVRITSIVGEDRSTGQQYQLPSMNITPIDSSQ